MIRPILVLLAAVSLLAERPALEFEVRWDNPPAAAMPRGCSHHLLHSQSMKRDAGWNIYLPPGYETGTARYPVIYWLHGAGGDESSGVSVAAELEKAITSGQIPPAILVFPNGG